jgi:ParB family chromosome partitioning protein
VKTKNPEEIKAHPTFESLFPIKPDLLEKIEQDMRDGRYDHSQPIILATWEGQEEPICIDGHTRLRAAKNSGIEEVPVWLHEFATAEEALEKAIKLQRNRRNMTDAEIVTCIEALDRKKPRGGDRRSEAVRSKGQCCPIENGSSSSAQETGDLLGISERKVRQARTVMGHADESTKRAVRQGDLSINQACQKTQEKRKQTAAKLKKTNSQEPASDEVEEIEQVADEAKQSIGIAPVFLSLEHFGALHQLGGSIEEHVASAIELYLESLREQDEENPVESDQEDVEDDDEYFDPDTYTDD